jgi:hypothetical protein
MSESHSHGQQQCDCHHKHEEVDWSKKSVKELKAFLSENKVGSQCCDGL